MHRSFYFLLLIYLTGGCVNGAGHVPVATQDSTPPQSAQEALRPYYATLTGKMAQAPVGPALAQDALITHFAFGSCVDQNRSMSFWDKIAAQKPQVFVLMGNAVCGEPAASGAADIPNLGLGYRKLNTRVEFDRFVRSVPMLTTWDDHDFGVNEGGASFAFKEYAEKLYESYWHANDAVRSRPGVYDSSITGPKGKRVQFILLDMRYFRSDLTKANIRGSAPMLGANMVNIDPTATLLGDAQWAWLAQEIAKPAELRFIISPTQVLSSAHGYEGWLNFPLEKSRLFKLLADQNITNAVFLSGNRRAGAFYTRTNPQNAKIMWEITSSALNSADGNGDEGDREPDPLRLGGLWAIDNFGYIEIDWKAKSVRLSLNKADGSAIEELTINPFN